MLFDPDTDYVEDTRKCLDCDVPLAPGEDFCRECCRKLPPCCQDCGTALDFDDDEGRVYCPNYCDQI